MAAVGVIDQGGGGLMDRWLALRDRLLAAPAFQHWAVRFPLTRPIANRRARALFDICTGFVYSQVLAACVQLRLFELLADGPRSAEWVAERLSLRPTAAFALLQAASGLRLWSSTMRCSMPICVIRSPCCAANSPTRR
jgi:demethylspheroidene O-methyltransferase